ncbi:phosphotransferase [Clostridium cibarium]|uniref:Phosphotransferase n=1 Tax=Clostridium cibarium TaxID=2762247 RepID=A0ABR8PY04_9CLOT|nr:phosphotransferase [Clostridium cibarium]MBD7913055.1 phosphotransferase [Clostridium cibarium]
MYFYKNNKLIQSLNESKIKFYLKNFIEDVTEIQYELIKKGYENISIKVILNNNKYLLRLCTIDKKHPMFSCIDKLVTREINFMFFLKERGIAIPSIYSTLQENKYYFVSDIGQECIYAILFKFVDGEHLTYNEATIEKTAKLQVKMHSISQNYKFQKLLLDKNEQLYSAMAYRMQHHSKLYTETFPKNLYDTMLAIYKVIYNEIMPYYKFVAKQIIHSDLKMDNILFFNEEIAAIIDFSDMRYGTIAEDLGIYIWDMCDVLYDINLDFIPYVNYYLKVYSKYNNNFRINDQIMAINYAIDRYLIINLYYLVENQVYEDKIKYQTNKAEKQLKIIKSLLIYKNKLRKRGELLDE